MAVGNTYIGSTYRVLRQAAYAEVQRLWGEWRSGAGRSRRSAIRRTGRKATVEALEPRQMLSVTASISGSSHVTESSSGYVLNLTGTNSAGTTRNGWNINWGDTSVTTASSAATNAAHPYTDGTYVITASFSDTETGVVHTSTATMTVTVDEACCGSPCLTLSACGTVAEGSAYTIFTSFSEPGGEQPKSFAVYWGESPNNSVAYGSTQTLSHTFLEPGSYGITVVAYDTDFTGGPVNSAGSYSATATVNVNEANPNVSVVGLPSVTEGSPYSVAGSMFDPANDGVSTYVVFWGDSHSDQVTPAQLAALTHVYNEASASNYSITLVAFDEDHSTGLSTWVGAGLYSSVTSVHVNEATPSFCVVGGAATTITEGSHYTPQLSFSDPGGDAVNYYVNWGEGGGMVGPYAAIQLPVEHDRAPHAVVIDRHRGDQVVADLRVGVGQVLDRTAVH
ncbi:MAG: hypothetical protein JWL69_3446, partial [Phycisphaerales bacterium]|nr:hypothetical protein [Phycisphaerales bacterium]